MEQENQRKNLNKEKFYTLNLDFIKMNKSQDAYCINIKFVLIDLLSKEVCSIPVSVNDLLYGKINKTNDTEQRK